ncbi:hypothetical protein DFH09DRAFT_1476277, partial [Mycena vulgaris]
AAEREKIIEWFSPLNFFVRQADIFSTRQPGACEWLLQDELLKRWRSGEGKTMWCRGMPSAGKTVLAYVLHTFLSRCNLKAKHIGVAVLYLNHKETEAQSPSNLRAGVWGQLVFGKPIRSSLHQRHARNHEPGTPPLLEETHKALSSSVLKYSKVFIVVDALDEYRGQQRYILLRHLAILG